MNGSLAATTAPLQEAITAHRRGDLEAAKTLYGRVLQLAPRHPDALHLLGLILAQQGEASGIAMIEQAIKVNPSLADAHFNLANIHVARNHIEQAASHFEKAVKLQPANLDALANLGAALLKLGRAAEAERYTRRALKLDPHCTQALLNMAALADVQGRYGETIALYDRVLARDPAHVDAHYGKALALLLRQDFAEAWAESRWRFRRPGMRAFDGRFPWPYWQGEDVRDRTLLVWTEQGPGDEILLASMLPDLIPRCRKLILICSPRMAPVFRRSFPSVYVLAAGVDQGDAALFADVAYQASMSELGGCLRPSRDAFGAGTAFLRADAVATARLRAKYLAKRPGAPLIGISWRSRNADVEREKTIALGDWSPILTAPDAHFVSLQYGDVADDIAKAGRSGMSITVDADVDALQDMDAFVAQVAAMDLVISVSNTSVHVAGGLGRPAWVLVPQDRGRLWYWSIAGETTPWYGSVRLFRQQQAGWTPVIRDIAGRLRDLPGQAS